MSPVRYELGVYIPDGNILRSHRREIFRYYINIYSLPFSAFLFSSATVYSVTILSVGH
jgi:hypothetical protein